MSSNPYTILQRIDAPEDCYLHEMLLWRAFGRFPEMRYDSEGDDWRSSEESRGSFRAFTHAEHALSAEETQYAGLPNDPRMDALEYGGLWEISFYDTLLDNHPKNSPEDLAQLEELRAERKFVEGYDEALEIWMVSYREYLDQFQTEICMKLRRGELTALGTKVPNPDFQKSREILEINGIELNDLEQAEIPKERWISQSINWEDSAIFGREESYVWILVNTEDMLRIFPPSTLIKPEHVVPIGPSFAVATSALGGISISHSKRGRPSLPWPDFHVEVARMFRDNEMPNKKEAAIVQIQDWFMKIHGKNVSRAAIGERLKPYFDRLIKG